MAKRIALQAGHQNCQYNSIVSLRGSTGAPNEMSFNVDIRNQVAAELRLRGFEVATTDANANDDKAITGKDFDLFLAIHYDADVYGKGGGFADNPEPSTDNATKESQRIRAIFEQEYFSKTGIVNHPERSNANTRYYYMWKYLTGPTPCVLLECGVGMHVPDDHSTLHFNRALVVEGIVRSICKAFDVKYELEQPAPQPTPAPITVITDENQVIRLGKIGNLEYGDMTLKAIREGLAKKDADTEVLSVKVRELETRPQVDTAKITDVLNRFDELEAQIKEAIKK